MGLCLKFDFISLNNSISRKLKNKLEPLENYFRHFIKNKKRKTRAMTTRTPNRDERKKKSYLLKEFDNYGKS